MIARKYAGTCMLKSGAYAWRQWADNYDTQRDGRSIFYFPVLMAKLNLDPVSFRAPNRASRVHFYRLIVPSPSKETEVQKTGRIVLPHVAQTG